MKNTAILLAGGSGSRMRGAVKDKVLEPLMGLPVILHSFAAFAESGLVEKLVFVCRDDLQIDEIKKSLKKFFKKNSLEIEFAYGGKERSDSVIAGLKKVADKSGLAFIHDGARPMLKVENIQKLAEAAKTDGAAVLAARVTDTIKRVPKNAKTSSKCKLSDLERNRLWAMQTPQVFVGKDIARAYAFQKKQNLPVTDDVAAAALLGIDVRIVENIYPNIKITLPEDLRYVEFLNSK